MSGKGIQTAIASELRELIKPEWVLTEWSVRRNACDTFDDVASYAPRLDIAVGPFNSTFENRDQDSEAIRVSGSALIDELQAIAKDQNGGVYFENPNPRCLLAIEVEHKTSSKHILGGITNASMLGRVGVVVGSTSRIDKVRRIHTYARKLKEVGKGHPELFGNVACCSEQELLDLLKRHRGAVVAR